MFRQPKNLASIANPAIVALTIAIASACSSAAQPDLEPESPEKPAETTDPGSTATNVEKPENVTYESCTVTFDQIPPKPLGFADVGNGGFVPGEGDCDRVNFYTGTAGDPINTPWHEQQIELCSLQPLPDVGVTGDYSIHVKPTNGEEIPIERDQTAELPEGTTIQSIRFELGDNLAKPPANGNDYLGKCQIIAPEEGIATEIGFSLDVTGTTQPKPNRFSPPEE